MVRSDLHVGLHVIWLCFCSGAGSRGVLHHPSLAGRGPSGRKWCHAGCLGDTGRRSLAPTESIALSSIFGSLPMATGKRGSSLVSTKCHLKPQRRGWINFKSITSLFCPGEGSQPAACGRIGSDISTSPRLFVVFLSASAAHFPLSPFHPWAFYSVQLRIKLPATHQVPSPTLIEHCHFDRLIQAAMYQPRGRGG